MLWIIRFGVSTNYSGGSPFFHRGVLLNSCSAQLSSFPQLDQSHCAPTPDRPAIARELLVFNSSVCSPTDVLLTLLDVAAMNMFVHGDVKREDLLDVTHLSGGDYRF